MDPAMQEMVSTDQIHTIINTMIGSAVGTSVMLIIGKIISLIVGKVKEYLLKSKLGAYKEKMENGLSKGLALTGLKEESEIDSTDSHAGRLFTLYSELNTAVFDILQKKDPELIAKAQMLLNKSSAFIPEELYTSYKDTLDAAATASTEEMNAKWEALNSSVRNYLAKLNII